MDFQICLLEDRKSLMINKTTRTFNNLYSQSRTFKTNVICIQHVSEPVNDKHQAKLRIFIKMGYQTIDIPMNMAMDHSEKCY